jgi:hypothetical protein
MKAVLSVLQWPSSARFEPHGICSAAEWVEGM